MKTELPLITFPPIKWWIKAAQNGSIDLVEDYVWEKQTVRNRYIIGGPNDRQKLSIPIYKPKKVNGLKSRLLAVHVAYEESWVQDHLRSVEAAYRKSPYFEFYFDGYRELLELRTTDLSLLNRHTVEWLNDKLGLSLPIRTLEKQTDDKEMSSTIRQLGKAIEVPEYFQVFEDRYGFRPNLSALDLLFNLGPESAAYLLESADSSSSS